VREGDSDRPVNPPSHADWKGICLFNCAARFVDAAGQKSVTPAGKIILPTTTMYSIYQ